MKKLFFTFSFVSLFGQNIVAQAIKEGDNSINVYYGFSLSNTLIKAFASVEQINLKTKTQGPVGFVYERMLTHVIGLGAEFGYLKGEFSFQEKIPFSNELYDYEFNYRSIRAQLRSNFHFARSERFDAYGLASVGVNSLKYTYVTNDPYYIPDINLSAMVFSLKVGLGLRYFIVENFGLHAEFALGAPIFCGGLSVKF